MRKNLFVVLALAVSMVLFMVTPSFAQIKYGTIRGTVKDETGEPFPELPLKRRARPLWAKELGSPILEDRSDFPLFLSGRTMSFLFL